MKPRYTLQKNDLDIAPHEIRPLSREDEPFLWRALYHAIHVPDGDPPPSPDIVHLPDLALYVRGWMWRAGDAGFVVEVDGNPVGAAWLRCWPGEDRGYGFLDRDTPELSMSVLPDWRGRGLGTELLVRLLAAASQAHDAVSLSVSTSNPARRLYERVGFEPVGAPVDGAETMVRTFSQ